MIGASAFGQGVAQHDAGLGQTLEDRHLDIGARHHREHRGARHAHHVRDDDEHERQHRQEGVIEPVEERRVGEHVGERGKPAEIDRDVFDQEIGEKIFRHRDRHQRDDIDQPVEHAALPDRRGEAEADGERNGDHRGVGREEHGVGEARRDLLQDVAPVGQRMAEIAVQRAEQPLEITHDGRPVEAEVEPQLRQIFRRRRVLQDGGGEVAGQDFRADEDERRRGEQRQDPENGPLDDQSSHSGRASIRRRPNRRAGPFGPARAPLSQVGRYDFSQALSRIMPLSMSKPPCGVWPPTLSLWASSQSRNTGMSAPPSSLSIACISQM